MKEISWGIMTIVLFVLALGTYYIFGAIADLLYYGGIDIYGDPYYILMDLLIVLFAFFGFISAIGYYRAKR